MVLASMADGISSGANFVLKTTIQPKNVPLLREYPDFKVEFDVSDVLPDRTRHTLARIELDIDAVTKMDWDVSVRRLTPMDAARAWLKTNESRERSWFDGSPRK
jgi:hypothetical protein